MKNEITILKIIDWIVEILLVVLFIAVMVRMTNMNVIELIKYDALVEKHGLFMGNMRMMLYFVKDIVTGIF